MLFPQLAKQAEITDLRQFFDKDDWVLEQKLDGHRILLSSPGGNYPPVALTRNGTPYTRKLPDAIQKFRFPADATPQTWVLDGELVDGVLWVFDIPRAPHLNQTTSLHQRRAYLERFVQALRNPAIKLVPQARTRDEKIALADKAIKENFEGLVAKHRHAAYFSGRAESWLKIKFTTTIDCVVTDVRSDGKESVDLGLWGPSVGAFGKGVATKDRVLHAVGRASLIGKEKFGTITKGDVVEVKYLYAGAGNRLYQPTILRKRDDKRGDECSTGQMKFVNKAVLEKL